MRILKGKSKKQILSIPQVLQRIEALDAKTKRIAHLLGYRSNEISKTFRQMLTMCNSVSIIFLQFDLLHAALYILLKAAETDVCMFFEGNSSDRIWHGRVLVYCNLGYFLHRIDDYTGSLKFLYDAESLILEIKDMKRRATALNTGDIMLAHASIAFLVLCRIERFKEAEQYLEILTTQFNSIIKGRRSKINSTGLSNLYCLIHLSIELFRVMKGVDMEEAISSCKAALENVKNEKTAAMTLLERFSQSKEYNEGLDILLSDEFQSVMFITAFFPFIGTSTPIINFTELCQAQERARFSPITKADIPSMIAPNLSPSDIPDNYSLIMKTALASVKGHN
ncbi:unnamed protein product [Blepharisma stoltei]|uniref:Uncharacterized protein n=1 Tax=Blepharisma stoltei TaxID=1481888 RepID=A0AAU9K7I2_9CILI|nr:unnamed protein product [Blepharisma stoltei]